MSRSSAASRMAAGGEFTAATTPRRERVGYVFIHVMIDDYSRVVYAEILGDERGPTCAAFILRAGSWFAGMVVAIERVITDNHFSYRRSLDFGQAVASIGAKQKFIQPRHPWTNGKAERFNRTMPRSGPTRGLTGAARSVSPRSLSGCATTTMSGSTAGSAGRCRSHPTSLPSRGDVLLAVRHPRSAGSCNAFPGSG